MTKDSPTPDEPSGPGHDRGGELELFERSQVGWRLAGERAIEGTLVLAAASSILITLGIVFVLVYESSAFFRVVSFGEFLTGTQWTPTFADQRFGILPLVCGTLVTTIIALLVSIPVGTIGAIWLSEYAPPRLREVVKPILELLAAVPTVVYGYFAAMLVTPLLQTMLAPLGIDLPGFNMLSAGLVMGVMIVPYVSSLSEDAMRAVPMTLREGSYATGATRMQTALRVVLPASISGVTAAYILGISRAVGETMVVAIAAGQQPSLTLDPTDQAMTMTAYIAKVSLGDIPHTDIAYKAVFAVGLTLLLITLVFNLIGNYLRVRFREAY